MITYVRCLKSLCIGLTNFYIALEKKGSILLSFFHSVPNLLFPELETHSAIHHQTVDKCQNIDKISKLWNRKYSEEERERETFL